MRIRVPLVLTILMGCSTSPFGPDASVAPDEYRTANRLGHVMGLASQESFPVEEELKEGGAKTWQARLRVDGGLSFEPFFSAQAEHQQFAMLDDIQIRSARPRFDTIAELRLALGKPIIVQQTVASGMTVIGTTDAALQARYEEAAARYGFSKNTTVSGQAIVVAETIAALTEVGPERTYVMRPGEAIPVPGIGVVVFEEWQKNVKTGQQADVATFYLPDAVGRVRVSYTGDPQLRDHSKQPKFGVILGRLDFIIVEHLGNYELLSFAPTHSSTAATLTHRSFELRPQ